jgi:predicted dehydrogenase
MSPNKIRVGVIGAGRMGERHCRVYSALPTVEFVGVAEASAERGQSVVSQYGGEVFADYRDLLDRVDAASVATPTDTHLEIAARALVQGVNVLVEKPLAGSVDQALELASLAARSSAVCQVGHIERFNPVFLELQAVVDEMQIVGLSARRLSPPDTSNTDVDVVFDLMIHDVDIALKLLGDRIERVHAYGRSAEMDAADYVVANLSIRDGPIASLTASRLTEQKVRLLEITALGAYIEADLLNKSIYIYRRTLPEYIDNHQRPLRYRQEGLMERIHIPTAEPLMLELLDFVRCAREQATPRVSAQDGLRAVELAAEIRACLTGVPHIVHPTTPLLVGVG